MAAGNVDTRIIQMQFDNREFERNIAKSQKSVEELKEAMNFDETSRGLEKFSKGMHALDFSVLSTNIQRLTDKFTGLGDAGEYVLSRIRAGLENAAQSVERFIRSISVDQIGAGQGKYDAMNKAVQTIIAGGKYSEKEAYGVMERTMEYTNQTSHSFTTMVGQISALQSIGMELSEAERFLEGIGNASTKAGAGATEAAGAMSLISKVVGGTNLGRQQFDSLNQTYRVITQEWRELAIEAGLATKDLEKKGDKIFTAKKYGKQVEVTVEQLENTLSKKWFTSDVAKYLYGKYQFGETLEDLKHPEDAADSFGKTAFLTGQRALTFADAMNAVKESVSSGWMDTFRILFGDVTEAAENFTNVCDRVIESLEKIKYFRNDVLKVWQTGGGRDNILDILLGDYWRDTETGAYGFMDLLDGLGKVVYDGFRDFLMIFGDPVDKMNLQNPRYLTAWFGANIRKITEGVANFMKGIRDFFNEDIDVGGKTKSRLEVIHEIVQGIVGALALGYMTVKEAIGFMKEIGDQLSPAFEAIFGFLGDLGVSIYDTADITASSGSIGQFFKDLVDILSPVTSGINTVVTSLVHLLRVILGLDEEGANGVDLLHSIGDVIKKVADIFSKSLEPILTFVSAIIDAFAKLIKDGVNAETLKAFGDDIGIAFTQMFETFRSYLPEDFSIIPDWLKNLFRFGEEGMDESGPGFFDKLKTFFESNFGTFNALLSNLTGGLSLKTALDTGFGFGAAYNFLNEVAGWFKGTNLYGVIMAFLGVASLGSLTALIFQAARAVKTVGGFFDDFGGNIKAGVIGEYEWFSEKLLNYAKAFLMIAGCVVLLGSMDTGALIQGGIAMALIMAAFLGISKSLSNMKGTYAQQGTATAMFTAIATSIVAIVAAMSVLMLAMIPLASDWSKMLTAFLGFGAVLTAMGAFIVIMTKQLDHFMVARFGGNGWKQIGKLAVMLLLIAGMVAVLAVSISALMVAITPIAAFGWDKVLAAVGGVGLILTSLGVFIVVMLNQMDTFTSSIGGGTTSWRGIAKMSVMLILLAGSVAILAAGLSVLMVAMAPLAAVGFKGIMSASVALGLILTEIGAFMVIMLNQMDEFAFNIGGGKTNAVSIAKMAGLMLVLSLSMVLLSVGLSTLILAITPLAALSAEGVVKAVGGLGVILMELGLFMNYLNKMNDGKKASVKLISFAGFAFSIGILVMALTPLALMDWAGWSKAMAGLGIILLELIGAMKLMQMAKVSTVSLAAFAGFAASIGILIFSLQPLAGMSYAGWTQALAGLGIVLMEMIAAMKIMDTLKVNAASLTGFIGFALSIAILIFTLKPLADMDTEGYQRAMFGLATVLLQVIVVMAIMNELKPNLATAGSTLLMLIGLGASMILFGIAFNEVKDVPWQNIVGFAAAISMLLVAIAGASILAKAGGVKGMLVLAVGLAAVIGVLALLAPVLIGSITSALTNMASHLMLISGMMQSFSSNMAGVDEGGVDKAERILGKLKDVFAGLFGFTLLGKSITSFTRAIAQLNLVASQLQMFSGKMAEIPDDGNIEKARTIIESVKNLFINELAGFSEYESLVTSFSSVMYQLGTALGTFEYNTQGIGDPAESNALKTIQMLSESAAGLDTIAKLNLDTLTSQMAGLGGAMMLYAKGAEEVDSLKEGDTPNVSAAVGLMQAISVSLAESGGFTLPGKMPDETQLGLFGSSLAAMAGALIQFEQAGSGLGDGTAQALKTLEFFRDLKQKLVDTEFEANMNMISAFGEGAAAEGKANELTTFGNNISQLAQSMGQFANATTYLDEETGEVKTFNYDNATKALESIADVANKLPKFDGAIDLLTGTRENLATFAGEIELLGSALNDFHTNTSVMDSVEANPPEFDYTNAIKALTDIAALPGKMPEKGGLIRLWSGEPMDLTDLAADIGALGVSMNAFSAAVTGDGTAEHPGFNVTEASGAITVAGQAVELLTELSTKLKPLGGLSNFFTSLWEGSEVTMKELGDQIGSMGEGLGKFGEGVSGKFTNVEDANNAIQAVEAIVSVMANIARMDQVQTTWGASPLNLVMDLNEFLAELMATSDANSPSAVSRLVEMMRQISIGMAAAEEINPDSLAVFSTFTDALVKLSVVNMDEITKNFEIVGQNIATGTRNGIISGTSGVINAAVDMAVQAYEEVIHRLRIKSPSRVFAEVGNYIALGMASGITHSTDEVVNATNGMTQSTINTAGNVMATISRIMAEGADANPTITPVLDLSQVEAGMSGLTGRTLGIDTSFSAARAGSIGQGSYDDTVSTIGNYDGIYERMAQLGETIENMGKSILQMKIVLDSGVVAGGVTDGVDQNLGRRIFYAGRNN